MVHDNAILLPLLAQAGLMIAITFWLAWARIGSLIRGKVKIADVRKNGWPSWIKNAGDNYTNQYEAPVLFMILCIVLMLMNQFNPIYVMPAGIVVLAWTFVGLRVLHALIHLSYNNILHRFLVFFTSMIVLTIMFIHTLLTVL